MTHFGSMISSLRIEIDTNDGLVIERKVKYHGTQKQERNGTKQKHDSNDIRMHESEIE